MNISQGVGSNTGGTPCPACGKPVSIGLDRCANCGEDLLLGIPDVPVDIEKDRYKEERKDDSRSRVLFWIGITLFLIGGPLLALFSLVHNYVGYPPQWQGSDVWDGYGPVDQMFGSSGLAIMAIGIVFLLLSLKRKEGKPKDESFDPTHPKGYNK